MVLCVEIDSPVETELKIYYIVDGQKGYSEEMSMATQITVGRNQIYFQVPINKITWDLRLDPGFVRTWYILHGVEGRSILSGE